MKKLALLSLLLIGLTGFSQSSRKISGTVYDAGDKQPLAGVMVICEGTHTGTVTNYKGYYELQVPAGKDKLTFKYVGYETQTIKIKSGSTINVNLKASQRTLHEIATSVKPVKIREDRLAEVALMPAPPQPNQIRLAGVSTFTNAKAHSNIIHALPGDDESYKGITENTFQNPLNAPLSTFSVDVDAASYSNVRRFINNGQLPPADAVRIEEMINYFNYDLPAPTGKEPVAITTELSIAPWNSKHQLLRIGLKARTMATDQLPASNLVFLIDVSGSMWEPNKLPLVQSALKLLVDQLRAKDKVAIVVYAGAAGLVLPATPGDHKQAIKDAIDNLTAGGSTAGGAGIKLAYKIAKENYIPNGNNRVILATDGDFNVGASSDGDMQTLIERQRKSGVFLSALGFGMGNYKDSKMETLADKGNGNYAYIDNITEARKTLVSEFGSILFTVAKDVKLQLEFNPAVVQAYRLVGYENRLLNKEDFNNDLKDAGDMGAGHTVTALYEIIPAGVHDKFSTSVDPLKYQKNLRATGTAYGNDVVTVKFRYKEPRSEQSKLSQVVVQNVVAPLNQATTDFRFAAAVAEFGMLLRQSDYQQKSSYQQVVGMARAAKGIDHDGYRAEFVKLAESVRLMDDRQLAAKDE